MKEIGVWIILLLLVYILATPDRGTAQHTVYELCCPDYERSVDGCPETLYTTKKTYLAIPETQTIIRKDAFLWKEENCIVFDAENWRCVSSNKHDDYDLMMHNGHYTDLTVDSKKPWRRTISRIEYIIRNILYYF
jgi:hypothetical protein